MENFFCRNPDLHATFASRAVDQNNEVVLEFLRCHAQTRWMMRTLHVRNADYPEVDDVVVVTIRPEYAHLSKLEFKCAFPVVWNEMQLHAGNFTMGSIYNAKNEVAQELSQRNRELWVGGFPAFPKPVHGGPGVSYSYPDDVELYFFDQLAKKIFRNSDPFSVWCQKLLADVWLDDKPWQHAMDKGEVV